MRWLFVLGVGACNATAPAAPVVQFKMESQTCGGPITFQFSIDQVVVGSQALRDGETSQAYATSPGQHTTRAAIAGAVFAHDTTMSLHAGETFTHVFSPYCS